MPSLMFFRLGRSQLVEPSGLLHLQPSSAHQIPAEHGRKGDQSRVSNSVISRVDPVTQALGRAQSVVVLCCESDP